MPDLETTAQAPQSAPLAAPVGGLPLLCDPQLDPLFWPSTRPTIESAWYGHVPFAHWIVTTLRPEMIVELGTYSGVSYSAFCEAVLRSGLETRCLAVDTWTGDEHAGFYGESVFQEFRAFHDSRYAAFSTLLRATFDEASEQFEDGSIDLLHIDGLHTYEAVSHDFETWLPKMGREGIVLLHDTVVHGRGFGVHRFWDEIRARYPSFMFAHSHGLGVVAVGRQVPPPIAALCELSEEDAERARERFGAAGELHELRSTVAIAVALMRQVPAPEAPPARLASPGTPLVTPRAQGDAGIAVIALRDARAPVQGLEDVWPLVYPLLRHIEGYNASETAVQDQQLGMIQDGCFILPSAMIFGGADTCVQSYYVPHRFFYRFDSAEEYFWITSAVEEAFALSTIYFPPRRIAVTLQGGGILESELLEFERIRASANKPPPDLVPSTGRRLVVTGYPDPACTLRNELPALDRAAAEGFGRRMKIAAACTPFGPLPELFPELDCEVAPFAPDRATEINSENGLIVGLGSLTIRQSTQERVQNAALRHTDSAVIAERDRFGRDHGPIFWLSIQPPPRTCLRQAEVLARLIVLIKQRYPSAGFILNGTSRPMDFDTNPNYAGWFADELAETSALTAAVIDEILQELDPDIREAVRIVTDVPVCEEISWGAIANFYFCHFETMWPKIGWTRRVPGMVHARGRCRAGFEAAARAIENGPPCYFVPERLVADVEPEAEGGDGGYRFTSADEVAHEVLAAFEKSAGAMEQPRLRPAETESDWR